MTLAKGSAMLTKPATQNSSKGGKWENGEDVHRLDSCMLGQSMAPVCGKLPGLRRHQGWIEDNRHDGQGREREREARMKNLTKLDILVVYIFSYTF